MKVEFGSLLVSVLLLSLYKGKNVRLSYADVVIVGNNCSVQTLYYTDSYAIAPHAKEQQIVRREKA